MVYLDPDQWRSRGVRLYGNRADPRSVVLSRDLKSRLLRVEAKFPGKKDTWNKAGTLLVQFQSTNSREVYQPFGTRFLVLPEISPYSIEWQPVYWLTIPGRVQIWEYMGLLTDDDLSTLSHFSEGITMPFYPKPTTIDIDMPESADLRSKLGYNAYIEAQTESQILCPYNDKRHGLMFTNESEAVAYVEIGGVASPEKHAFQVEPGEKFELPYMAIDELQVCWLAAEGGGVVRELVALDWQPAQAPDADADADADAPGNSENSEGNN